MGHPKNLAQKIFGRLTAISLDPQIAWIDTAGRRRIKPRTWFCRCECGNEVKVRTDRLLEGKTRSCGCLQTDIAGADPIDRAVLVDRSARVRAAIAAGRPIHELFPLLPPKVGADACHGLPRGTYSALFDAQNGRCFICGCQPPDGQSLYLDHDHATQQVRGLLCNTCNTGLGCFKDSPARLARAAYYLSIERPALLSRQITQEIADEERQRAYQERKVAWQKAREEKEAQRLEKYKQRCVAQEVRRAERLAKKAVATAKREQLYREREKTLEVKLREWDAIEQERKAARIARRDAKRAARDAEKERIRLQTAEDDARWGQELALITSTVFDYGQPK